MSNKNIIELLNKDCQDLVTSFLDMKSLLSASRVSKTWHGLFTHPDILKNKIKSDFAIDQKILSKLPIPEDKEKYLFYKQLYIRLYRLKQKKSDLPKFVRNSYHDQTQQNLLLMACADNADYMFENTLCEEQYMLTVMSIYADCINIPIAFLKNHRQPNEDIFFLTYAAKSGNLPLVKYLLNPENGFNLKPNEDRLKDAAKSGNLQLVQYLLIAGNGFNLKPDQDTLSKSAGSGNLELVQYLLNPENQFNVKPDEETINKAAESGNFQLVEYLLIRENQINLNHYDYTLHCAAKSGNLQLVQYLLIREKQFSLYLDKYSLYWAAKSGNLKLIKCLLNPENQFDLKPHVSTTYAAAEFGNFHVVEYLLNPKNRFNLKPDLCTLFWAIKSDNFQLVEYLLNRENQFGLKPDQNTLNVAAELGNFQLVQYLLNRENQFNLIPNQTTLNKSIESGNLRLVKYLLNPKNRFNLNLGQEVLRVANKSGNFGLSEYLLPSHLLIQQALQKLEKNDFDSAMELLQKSYTACPNHCTMWMEYILKNASEFNLNRKLIRPLSKAFEEMKTSRVASQEETAKSHKKIRSIYSYYQDDDCPIGMDLS